MQIYQAQVPLLLAACTHRCTSGVMKAGVLLGMSSERWTDQSLQQLDRWQLEIIINLNRFCDQDTKCLGVAIRIIACDGHG